MSRFSLARRHRERCAAEKLAVASAIAGVSRPADGAAVTQYDLIRAQLGQDLARLREIQSLEAKIDLKRQLLPNYQNWVDGVLEAAEGSVIGQDDVFVQVMIWSIDVGDFDRGLQLARHVLEIGMDMPQRFTRTAGCFVAEAIADVALAALGRGECFELRTLQRTAELTADEDMPDQVRAKLNKAIGLELAAQAEAIEEGGDGPAGAKRAATEAALAALKRAVELDPKAGVKKRIETLDRAARRLAEPAGGQS